MLSFLLRFRQYGLIAALPASLSGLFGCSPADKPTDPALPASAVLITRNDFEAVAGWGGAGVPASISTDQAHSGRYSVRAGRGIEYAYGYSMPLRLALPARPTRLHLKGWFYRAARGETGALVINVVRPSNQQTLFYESVSLAELRANRWVTHSAEVALPDSVTSLDVLNVFLWSAGSAEPIFLDDLEVTAIP